MRPACLLIFAALSLAGPVLAQEGARQKVDLELYLAVDGSGSIQEDEFAFQRQAYAVKKSMVLFFLAQPARADHWRSGQRYQQRNQHRR